MLSPATSKGDDYSFLVFGKTEIDLSPFDVAGDRIGKACDVA